MKPNINNVARLTELRDALRDKGVSESTVLTVTNAVKSGLVVKGSKDIGLLSVPAAEAALIATAVTFGASQPEPQEFKTLQFTFHPIGTDVDGRFFGYQLILTYTNNERYTIEETYPIEDSRRVIVDVDLNEVLDTSRVLLHVKSPQGEFAKIALGSASSPAPTEESISVFKTDLKNADIAVGLVLDEAIVDPAFADSYQIKGKLIVRAGDTQLEDYQILILAATEASPAAEADFLPVAYATTETHGYFLTSFLSFPLATDINRVGAAKALVRKGEIEAELPIQLIVAEGRSILPRQLILVLDASDEHLPDAASTCDGCGDLNFHEKKVLEEFSYYTVVRTTEPAVIADVIEEEEEIDLSEIYGESAGGLKVSIGVFRRFHAIKARQSPIVPYLAQPAQHTNGHTNGGAMMLVANGGGNGNGAARSLVKPAVFTEFDKLLLDRFTADERADQAADPHRRRLHKGRARLTPLNQINWDKPTVYQAATIAHGHLLHFKQQWLPDGYSIGDLLYSLPLAPGQKKQIAVLDWERRESAASSQVLDYEESLNNSLVRDRDISEVVRGTLDEDITGESTAKTSSFAAGLGGAAMGIIKGITFGSVLGISGGKSKATSNASQTSHRESTANSLQSIRDRTQQSASSVRSQRSTVIHTVGQGERVEATSESVANYNHCHAITIQYFEVLRHFAIQTRFSGAQECLFVPLQISNFDIEKALRWRNTLERRLRTPRLRTAFAALERIQNERESAAENYYDSIGYPRNRYAEQQVLDFHGELFLEFYFFNTKDTIDDALILFFKRFFKIDLNEYKDRKLTDAELSRIVGPRTIEHLLDALVIETQTGQSLNLDVSLLTPFRQNARLQVSLRQAAPISIAREAITGVRIRIDENKVKAEDATDIKQFSDKYLKILVRSGQLRYNTSSYSETLFNTRIDNDLFVGIDSVFVPTPLNGFELRNPRGEDVDAANNLIHHLNENLEYYHKCIWFDMTPERRYMLLDGIIAPGKANGRSVASVVENRIVGVAGNSLIMPVAPGFQLDPTIDDSIDLFARYYNEDLDPARVSLPTKGVYAEAVIGKCNSCEEKDEGRFWRWEESPIPDSPNTQINPISLDSRRADPGDLDAKDFPAPIVNVQNAPAAPDPTGLQSLLALIGKGDAFRDITGLSENQKNALAAFQSSLQAAQSFGKQAADLAKTAGMIDLIKTARKEGNLSKEAAEDKTGKVVDANTPPSFEEKVQQTQKQLEMLKNAFESGNIDSDQLTSLSESVLKESVGGSPNGLSPTDVSRMTQNAKQNQANVSLKTGDEEVEIDTQPRRLKRLTRDGGVEEVEETTGGFVSDGSLFEQPALAQQTIITVKNRFNEELIRNCTVSIDGQQISGVTNISGVVRLDLSDLPDGTYKLTVTPPAVKAGATYSGLGNPADNPPDRIWEEFSAELSKQGDLISSAESHIGILNNRINIRLKPEWMRTPNQGARPAGVDPSLIIVHHTGSSRAGTAMNGPLAHLMNPNPTPPAVRASAHYIIDREGAILKLAHESRDAWQAGRSHWGGLGSVGEFSIGIEVVHSNNGPAGESETYVEDFTQEQYDSLLLLLTDITSAFDIAPHRVVGHSDIGANSPITRLGRKSTDPGRKFDWSILEANGFGLFPTGGLVDIDIEFGGFFDQFESSSLRPGDRDSDHRYGGTPRPSITANLIEELQADLRTIGYYCPPTGVFDTATAWTVHMFNQHFFSGPRYNPSKNEEHVDLETAGVIKGIVRTLQSV
jgi:N-acetyl-anhydromuramyl-L-alanine amidase AmpD